MFFARFKLRSAYKERTDGRSKPIMLEALVTTLSSFIFVRLYPVTRSYVDVHGLQPGEENEWIKSVEG